ncbi:uncharacterized protein FA14DRAFT_160280 [Meira miltonrushii]|uniref:Uncharacterized protein n=1 Tax=Meira miltonrushii TaxID=1280837 RepID=A0A316VCK7_9BASI|nr:uncharacterized protein FA14DRAFT_160280 [Meira miltonrushii]PWN34858.1 hypothetical protein FA14DRAFT_160280 [Meira miltonrushii]
MDGLDPELYLNDDTPAPLENLFTLPFALHLKPLPHQSFLAEQDSSNASSDQDDNGEDSDASSANSNYKAGMHRLRQHTSHVPPHSLKMISMLLERTGCLDAVPVWGQLIEMLDGADEDPHFANLRAFFDARFDTNGRIKDESSGLQRSISGRKRGSFTRSQNTGISPPKYDYDIRRPSVASSSGAANLFNLKRRKSSKVVGQEEYEEGSLGDPTGTSFKPRQPEIIVVGKEGVESRAVRFKVRLDLHSIGLAPPPPRPPIMTRGSARSTISKRLTASPPQKYTSEFLGVHRVLSNTSSNHSHSDSLSLHPIGSPDSFRSHALSEDSDENHQNRSGFLPQNGSPAPSSRAKDKKSSRTFTNSSAALTSVTSEFGTSPESADARAKASGNATKVGSFSKNGEAVRRPSMIKKLMDFKGLRSGSTRSNRSASNMSSQSTDEIIPQQDTTAKLVLNTSTGTQPPPTVASPTSDAPAQGSSGFSFNHLDRRRSQTVQSDMSNEEAIDMIDDEGSIASSNHFGSLSKRRASSSANANSLLGFKPAPGMRPVQEGTVFSTNPVQSDEDDVVLSSSEATGDVWKRGEGNDFLNLWRKAANTSLTLRQTLRPTMTSPARTPKGSASAGISPFPNAQTPPDSIELEDQERIEALLAPFRNSEAGSWWLSGSVDPLPISIACALSEGLGWNGIMDLCYGKGSRSERSGSYQPLGRAAELDKKQEADKSRVQNWAQAVAGNPTETNDAKVTTQGSPTNEEIVAREKLASLALTTEASSDAVGPSESASVKGKKDQSNNLTKIGNWLKKKSGLEEENPEETNSDQEVKLKTPFADSDTRSWQDWAELLRSISRWLVEYETTRVRNGMAGEYGHDILQGKVGSHVDSGFVDSNFDMGKTKYVSRATYQVPRCVIKDALNKQNGFRRRHGIPEGLPIGPDGTEIGEYRWSRSRLSGNHFATATTLAANSLFHCLEQIATSDWTHASAWELDYMEMCVFRSPIVGRRFPAPGSKIVSSSQTFHPDEQDEDARKRAMPCPYPSADGVWSSTVWRNWLSQVQNGNIIVPAVSWQAWWTLIAVLNGGDGSDRALDVQMKAESEPFSALDDLEAVYL